MSHPDPNAGHVFLACGDPSGERLAARVVTALRRRRSGLRFSALGGATLATAGVTVVQPADRLAVMGFTDILHRLPDLWHARRAVRRRLTEGGVDLFVPVDFPGFNVPLARAARRAGVPVCYLVAPQLWAWGGWRLSGLRRAVDSLGVILPFEEAFFRRRGIPARFLGHPLLADYPRQRVAAATAAREERLRRPETPWHLLLLPGSRPQEAAALGPLLLAAAGELQRCLGRRPLAVTVSVTPGTRTSLATVAAAPGVRFSEAPLPELLGAADLALVCSGTASLETALANVPHVVVYRTRRLDYLVARPLVRVPHVALANLVLGRSVVPERIQGAAVPARLADDLLRWARDPVRRRRFREAIDRLRRRLECPGGGSFAEAAADLVLATLAAGPGGESGRGRHGV